MSYNITDVPTAASIEVFYAYSDQVWVVQWRDEQGNQLGDCEYSHRKEDAVDTAQAYFDSERTDLVRIFTKAEKLQREIKR